MLFLTMKELADIFLFRRFFNLFARVKSRKIVDIIEEMEPDDAADIR